MAFLIAPDRLRDLKIAELRCRLQRNERRQQCFFAVLLHEEEQRAQHWPSTAYCDVTTFTLMRDQDHKVWYIISTKNCPATVRLSGGCRAVAARSLNRRPAAVVNGLQVAGRWQLNSSCRRPATLLPLAGYFRVSRFPRAFETNCRWQAAFCWQFYVTAISDV